MGMTLAGGRLDQRAQLEDFAFVLVATTRDDFACAVTRGARGVDCERPSAQLCQKLVYERLCEALRLNGGH